jgi:hypothetical protein
MLIRILGDTIFFLNVMKQKHAIKLNLNLLVVKCLHMLTHKAYFVALSATNCAVLFHYIFSLNKKRSNLQSNDDQPRTLCGLNKFYRREGVCLLFHISNC